LKSHSSTQVGLPGSCAVTSAADIEADLDVKVRMYNRGAPGMTSTELLRSFWINQKLRDAISEADSVILVIGFNDLALPLVYRNGRGACDGGDDGQVCLRENLDAAKSD
jgi:hypothetical protein